MHHLKNVFKKNQYLCLENVSISVFTAHPVCPRRCPREERHGAKTRRHQEKGHTSTQNDTLHV